MNLLADAFVLSSLLSLVLAIVAFLLAVYLVVRYIRRGFAKALVATLFSAALIGFGALIAVAQIPIISHRAPQILLANERVGSPLPDMAFDPASEGSPLSLQDLEGKVVLVNIWATWCVPCRHEMPALERLQTTYGDDLVVLLISDEPLDKVAGYVAESTTDLSYVRIADYPWKVGSRPTSYVLDRTGIVRRTLAGARPYEHFDRAVKSVL